MEEDKNKQYNRPAPDLEGMGEKEKALAVNIDSAVSECVETLRGHGLHYIIGAGLNHMGGISSDFDNGKDAYDEIGSLLLATMRRCKEFAMLMLHVVQSYMSDCDDETYDELNKIIKNKENDGE